MRIQRVVLAVMLASLLAISVAAQRAPGFEPGYIVLATGDSLVGDIADRSALEHTLRVFFQEDGEDFAVFRPHHLSAYGFFDGRRYVSRDLVPGPYQERERLFLQVLVDGSPTLYAYSIVHRPPPLETGPGAIAPVHSAVAQLLRAYHEQLEISNHRFALETEGRVRPLYEYRRLHDENPHRMVVDRQYRRVLAESFAGCPPEQARLRRVRFASRELINAVERYHSCVEKATPGNGLRMGLGSPGLRLSLSARGGTGTSTIVSRIDGAPADGRAASYAALRMDVLSRSGRDRTALTAEIAYKTKSTTADEDDDVFHPFRARHFNLPVVATSLGAQHALDVPGRPTLGAGITGGRLIGQEPKFVENRPYTWDVGFFAELSGRLSIARTSFVTAGIRGELTRLGDTPLPLGMNRRGDYQYGHGVRSLFFLIGVGL